MTTFTWADASAAWATDNWGRAGVAPTYPGDAGSDAADEIYLAGTGAPTDGPAGSLTVAVFDTSGCTAGAIATTANLVIGAGGALVMVSDYEWLGNAALALTSMFSGASVNSGIIGDCVVFNGNAYNDGTAGDYVTFNDNSINVGTVGDYATFNGASYNIGTVGSTPALPCWMNSTETQSGTFDCVVKVSKDFVRTTATNPILTGTPQISLVRREARDMIGAAVHAVANEAYGHGTTRIN